MMTAYASMKSSSMQAITSMNSKSMPARERFTITIKTTDGISEKGLSKAPFRLFAKEKYEQFTQKHNRNRACNLQKLY